MASELIDHEAVTRSAPPAPCHVCRPYRIVNVAPRKWCFNNRDRRVDGKGATSREPRKRQTGTTKNVPPSANPELPRGQRRGFLCPDRWRTLMHLNKSRVEQRSYWWQH